MADPNITLMGATYPSVSGVSLPKSGGGTATFPWVEGSETKTENGTYDVTRLAEVVVNVPNSGLYYVTPEEYGAVGDGTTDDSQAVQDACDAGYAVYFSSGKTYYLASTVTIDHDCHLFGGENTVIKTKNPSSGTINNAIVVTGALKKTTALTTNYSSTGTTANSVNRFTLSDMSDISIGDIMVITATDQYYSYARDYYYLGATLLITDIYGGHIYTSDSMPWDITNSTNVSVKIYSAPTAIIEGLHFESEIESGWNYRYLLSLLYCKGSVVRNCTFTQMDSGIKMAYCVNTLVDNVSLSKSKYDNTLTGDGYGIVMASCTNTIFERILATCAQHAIAISGNEPAMNTYVHNCELTSECRAPGLDTHEATYNLVIEDCVLGTASLNSTVTMNRCRIINNRRFGDTNIGISVYGSHDPGLSRIIISNTIFEGTSININRPGVQSPVQAFDNIYGCIEITNCVGGALNYVPTTDSNILSNQIKQLTINGWKDCKEIYFDGTNAIDRLDVIDSTFTEGKFINDHNGSHGVITSGIGYLNAQFYPMGHQVSVDRSSTYGEKHTLPGGVVLNLSSNNASAVFRVCGNNLTPNVRDDYRLGSVTGSDGGTLSRTEYTGSDVSLAINSDGDPVYTQGNNTSKYSIYPIGMFCVDDLSSITISATLKNTGATSGASFIPFIALVNSKTGALRSRYSGSLATASSSGASMTYSHNVSPGDVVLCYVNCYSPVANAVTTFEDFSITCTPYFAPSVVDEPYVSKRRTGDGTITALPGVNNIMCSEATFDVSFAANYLDNPVGMLQSAVGVSF